MRPENFREANAVRTAKGRPGIAPLNVHYDGEICLSLWRPTWRERISFLVHGRIWLYVLGHTLPPVTLVVKRSVFSPGG